MMDVDSKTDRGSVGYPVDGEGPQWSKYIYIWMIFWVRMGRFTRSDKIFVDETSQYDPLNPEAEDDEDVS